MARTWIARVAQEYEFQADNADAAVTFANALIARDVEGATLKDGEWALAEKRTAGAADA